MKKIKEFKSRCSSNGKLTGAKGLGKTGQSYASMWAKEQKFNRRKEIKSKYLERGNVSENESIEFINKMLNINVKKNVEFFEDEFFTGTPDMLLPDEVIDVKNSWDWSTFPIDKKEIPNSDYYDQLQGYMHLTGRKKARLIYVLSDTPEHLIEKEAWYYCKSLGFEELEFEIFEQFQKDMTYSDIPDNDRIIVFEIEYNEAHIKLMQSRILECREFLKKQK